MSGMTGGGGRVPIPGQPDIGIPGGGQIGGVLPPGIAPPTYPPAGPGGGGAPIPYGKPGVPPPVGTIGTPQPPVAPANRGASADERAYLAEMAAQNQKPTPRAITLPQAAPGVLPQFPGWPQGPAIPSPTLPPSPVHVVPPRKTRVTRPER